MDYPLLLQCYFSRKPKLYTDFIYTGWFYINCKLPFLVEILCVLKPVVIVSQAISYILHPQEEDWMQDFLQTSTHRCSLLRSPSHYYDLKKNMTQRKQTAVEPPSNAMA